MNRFVNTSFLIRRNILVLMGISLSVYFSYHTLSGQRSYSYLQSLELRVKQERFAFGAVQEKRAGLEDRVKMMRPGSIHPDLLEERVRLVLGYKHPEELVVFSN